MKAKIFSFAFLLVVVFVFSLVSAQVPNLINYQGKLTTPAGGLMDTVVSMRFSIYADSTTPTYLWQETQTPVTVSKSVFNVLLGSVTPIPGSIFDGSIRYLGIKVGTDFEMSPRKPFVSVGYAYKSLNTDTAKTVTVPLSLSGSSSAPIISANNSSSGEGVRGVSPNGTGVFGQTSNGSLQWPTAPSGIVGTTNAPPLSGISYGVRGVSYTGSGGAGVFGYASSNPSGGVNHGVWGISNSTYNGSAGVVGQGSGAVGTYGVYYSGGLGGSGSKSCVVKTSQGPVLLYCQESPESWFEDFGEGQLLNGKAHIELDPLFLETVSINDQNLMKVFIQLNDENCQGTAVKRGLTGFDVVELNNGTSNAHFTYRVVAKRKGFEDKRLERCEAGLFDPYLYPELREKELER